MDSKGVSPVLGITLVLLLTAVTAVFVIKIGADIAGSLKKGSTPIFKVERVNSTYIEIVLYSTGGAESIERCRVKYGDREVCSGWSFEVGTIRTCRVGHGPEDLFLLCHVDGREKIVLKARI